MLNRNAQWWAHQEKITQTTLSDMLASSSTSSTSSNSSSDSNDSIATTPTTASTMMSMSTLMISPPYSSVQASSPLITPMEPKTDMPPPPLYQTRRSFDTTYQSYHQKQFNRSHRHSTAGIYHHHQQAEPPFILTSSASASTPSKSSTSLASPILNDPYSISSSYDRSHLLDTEKNDYYDDSESTNLSAIPLPSGHTTFDTKLGLKKRRRGNLPKHVTEYLKGWLLQHKKHPYPTERQKLELAQRTGLAVNQISNWFINARRRILQPMLETEQLFAKQQQHHYSHSRFLSSNLGNPTNPSTSALATTEDKKRRQLDIYAYHGFTDATHDTQGWSVRRTKLPNIEIPEKDQHIFATGH
ncbi:hypothetical protein [Absidia glauca]|uniref:Homeobox domain-containing protein n=1 Tax=Absidia glauca TaxID=4829 RepID=A0A168NVR2_ABSGL|nr:hypothetical protein [Absidia glauca]